MNIVWATSEAAPYAKTGGLADVSYSLPYALAENGHNVSVFMPYYPQVMAEKCADTECVYELLGVPFGEGNEEWARIRRHKVSENLSFYFIEFDRFFDRPKLYDWDGNEYSDNAERFIFLSRAIMQAVLALDIKVDVLHSNDWHTSLCNVYVKSALYNGFDNFKQTKSIITIHNIGYQGVFSKSNLYWTGLGWEYFNVHCFEFYDKLNFLKAGVLTADMATTVSPTYAEEILSPEYGFGLENPLQHRAAQGKLRGILNGIDVLEWDPATDNLLPHHFSHNDLSGKALCKVALQKEFGMEVRADVPIYGVVSRLAEQKGLDVFIACLDKMLEEDDAQFVIVGSGEKWQEVALADYAKAYPDRFGCHIGYSNKLAHLVEAGADFFVMPSRYEPCGLNQMYSMKYGTVPIVRSTGGLEDTVSNYSIDNIDSATGFKFYDLYPDALRETMRWAASIYRNDFLAFETVMKNGMTSDFSWHHTAVEYEDLYQHANTKFGS
ncbi:glycogen synthase (ADP-glucose) [Psychromonas ingrahamii 37]|uniref:Glycogen synthase n=1 Tax=Psychromonas ingrahamii (strain DSM 17664 / CCUG 51855 / 37) TaxID=357804 RepID=A1SX72_PSYIN|nr:glycogen synthase GlgA [Psychromonas ingrahamii]ABM04087.1 glycogen synthase (ADP-glucose) [Psychromonas ingrahamii 37]